MVPLTINSAEKPYKDTMHKTCMAALHLSDSTSYLANLIPKRTEIISCFKYLFITFLVAATNRTSRKQRNIQVTMPGYLKDEIP